MRSEWAHLSETERSTFTVLMAFLNGRLATIEAVNWALQLRPHDSIKRAAILQMVDSPEGRRLAEPWRSAWRMIEEYWDTSDPTFIAETRPYDIGDRVRSGDRTGSLLIAIADCVAPRVRVSPVASGKSSKSPRNVTHLLSLGLTSNDVVDPVTMALHEIEEDSFLEALANALEGKLAHGLDTARRLGWDGERKLYQLGQLHRAYFVPEADRKAGEHEPDEFHKGIAPCVKLLHFVVDRLARHRAPTARRVAARWKMAASPLHARLWAALARDPWVAPGPEVGSFFELLDDHRFWDVQNFPEIAELRAVRFPEFDLVTQRNLVKRLRRMPPRSEWPRGTDPERIRHIRRYRAIRELRRIELAGGALAEEDKVWLVSEIANFPELVRMSRLDDGFMGTAKAAAVPANPDPRYNDLIGRERLSALEVALGSIRRGWDDDASGRAGDWIRQASNVARLIPDLESVGDGGAVFPKLWERFGWTHSPPTQEAGKPKVKPEERLFVEAERVLALLHKLPDETLRQAIDGISEWMSRWQPYAFRSERGIVEWQRLWPLTVEATNAAQPDDGDHDLNLTVRPSDDREPMDLDTLNTPAGKFVGVFLQMCPRIEGDMSPFAQDTTARTMRDTVMAASGRSGLIVRHRLIEELPYFLSADPDWAKRYLIGALLEDSGDALSLWRAVARQTQFVHVLRVVGDAMVGRATDLRLGRQTRRSLVFSLVVECLHALNENRASAVTYARIQQLIRTLDDEVRADAAGAVQQFVRELSAPRPGNEDVPIPEDLFSHAAEPFLRNVWPQERSLSTPGVSKALADLPATARGAFVIAVDAVQRFLVPFDTWSLIDYGLFGDVDGKPKLSLIDNIEKGEALLRLLDCTIGTAESAIVPYDLGTALTQIETVAPRLVEDPKFRRLATAARR